MYCDFTLRSVGEGGACSLYEEHLIGAFLWLLENPPLLGNAATLAVRGNISPVINITMSAKVTEFRAVVRTQ